MYGVRFEEGLQTLGVLTALREYRATFKPLFCRTDQPLTAELMKQIFRPECSLAGSSKRAVENAVYCYFLDYLQSIEGIAVFCETSEVEAR